MARECDIFAATEVLSLEMNPWGANIEQMVSDIRNAVILQGVDTVTIRNSVVPFNQRTDALGSVGGRAVTELDATMVAFRPEIVFVEFDNYPFSSGPSP